MLKSVKIVIIASALAIAAAAFACGCAKDGEKCYDFSSFPAEARPQGCVAVDFNADALDFAKPCDAEYLKVCTADEGSDCLGYVCEKGK